MLSQQSEAEYDKISAIFTTFDVNKDGMLDNSELKELVKRCNPLVELTCTQLDTIVSQVFTGDNSVREDINCTGYVHTCQDALQALLEYEASSAAPGLSKQGLAQLYLDGVANSSADYDTLNLPSTAEQQVAQQHCFAATKCCSSYAASLGHKGFHVQADSSTVFDANQAEHSGPPAAACLSPSGCQVFDAADDFSDLFDLTPLPVEREVSFSLHDPVNFTDFDASENVEPNTASLTPTSATTGKAASFQQLLQPSTDSSHVMPLLHQQSPSPCDLHTARTSRVRGSWAKTKHAASSERTRAGVSAVGSDNHQQVTPLQVGMPNKVSSRMNCMFA